MTELRSFVSRAGEFRSGTLTPRAFLEECLDRIAKHEPRIGAFVNLNIEGARTAADAATKRWHDGKPLSAIDGMPIAVKDVIETADSGLPSFQRAVASSAACRAPFVLTQTKAPIRGSSLPILSRHSSR